MKYVLLAFVSAFCSSVGTILYGDAIERVDMWIPAAALLVGGGTLLTGYHLVKGDLPSSSQLIRFAPLLFLLILLRYWIGCLLFAHGLEYTESIKVVFFTKIEPYLLMLWAWIFEHRRSSFRHVVLLSVHVGAALLLSTGDTFEFQSAQYGDLLILGAMLLFSLSYYPARTLARELGSSQTNGLASLGAIVLLLPLALWFTETPVGTVPLGVWIELLFVIVLFNILGFTLWYSLLGRLELWVLSALRTIGPVLAAPVAWVWFNETLTWIQMVGGIGVVATSGLIALEHTRGRTARETASA